MTDKTLKDILWLEYLEKHRYDGTEFSDWLIEKLSAEREANAKQWDDMLDYFKKVDEVLYKDLIR